MTDKLREKIANIARDYLSADQASVAILAIPEIKEGQELLEKAKS
ncbi:hypothetical protein LCGC14_1612830 [marine sediment metagenome]|uniref:Uncharacterized protein n=1 Tax=marine sediment metagenome TaxID=412755 RepID=A0A0F9I7R9_9ZZZZ